MLNLIMFGFVLMRRFFLFFLVSLFCLNSLKAMNDFDPDFHWEEMHYYAKSRSDWHKDACQKLSNDILISQ